MSIVLRAIARAVAVRRATGFAALFGLFAALSPAPAIAHEFKVGAIEVEHPWSRATPPGAKTGAGYFGLTNTSSTPDRLVALSSPVAPRVEVHLMSVEGGIMTMKPVEGGVEIPAGGRVALAPGGYHLMLMGLTRPLVQGEMVPVTLTFEKAGAVTVQLEVDAMGAKAPSHEAMGENAAGQTR
jgi:copper(I)-binding protein